MFDKLDTIASKFHELTAELAKPEIASDPIKYQALAKERAAIEDIVSCYQKFKGVEKQIADNKALIATQDEDLAKMAQEELPHLEKQLDMLRAELRKLLIPKDPNDDRGMILEIRAGTGGEEAALFAGDLLRMYRRFAEDKAWKFEILEQNPTGLGGYKEIIAEVNGKGAYGQLKFESGVHRVQRVPKTEASGRIHTSACTVAVLPEADEIDIQIDPKELRIDTYRSGGAGGQHVNKTDSAVRITHLPTGLAVACQDDRSQHKNRAKAFKILRSRLFDLERERQEKEISDARKLMVKSGDRSEKIRTYNFPQNRLTDHRIGLTLYNLDAILDGKLGDIIDALRENSAKQKLEAHE